MPERAHGHLKQFCCLCLVTRGCPQGLHDVDFFQILEMGHEIDARFGQVKFRADALRIVIGDVVGQLFGLNFTRPLKCDGTFDGVFEFTNIAMPRIVFKQLYCFRRDRQALASLITKLFDEMFDQIRNILGPFAKRRQVDRDDRNSIKKVFTKCAVLAHLL